MTFLTSRISLIFTLCLLFTGGNSSAATLKNAKKKDPLRAQNRSQKISLASTWSGWVQYDVRTDLADSISPRLYTHQFSGGITKAFPHRWSASLSLLAAYESVGANRGEVLVDQQEFFLSDVQLSGSKKYSLIHSWWMIPSLSNSFQTSKMSQEEGYLSVTSGSLMFYRLFFRNRIRIHSAAGSSYIWNTYRVSPQTLEINPSSSLSLGLGGQWFPWGTSIYIGLDGGMKFTRYLDHTTDRVFRNSISVGGSYRRWNFSASLSNGSYLNREEKTFFFIDEFRKTAIASVSYSF